MNKIALFILLICPLIAFGQEQITVSIQERPSSQGIQPAFEVEVPQATANDAISILERTLAPRGLFGIFSKNPRLVQEKDEWIMRDVEVKKISAQALNVYAQVSAFPERIFIKIFFQEGGVFIGSKESGGATVEDATRFVRDYALAVYRDAVEKELHGEENNLRALERDLRKMGRQQNSNDRKISNMRSDNQDMRSEIRDYEMRLQRKELFDASGNEAQGMLEQHEADAKKLRKDIRSNQKKINRNERRINKFERQGNRNLREQGELMNTIDRQKIVVNEIKTKLQNIK
ncbi:MAG: hypothetical protein ACOZDD_00695 [Bacteroidota bacterium]